MNSPFAMNHIPLRSLIMPWLVKKRPGATKHLKMSSTTMAPFCQGIVIIVSLHERKRIPYHWQLDCLLHGLFDLRTNGTSHIRIGGSSRLESMTSRLFVKKISPGLQQRNPPNPPTVDVIIWGYFFIYTYQEITKIGTWVCNLRNCVLQHCYYSNITSAS